MPHPIPRLVAIGGGELYLEETLAIDQMIVAATGKLKPNALFIPTASGDSPEYSEFFSAIYGTKLGCHVRTLALSKPDSDPQSDISWADLVYVGGGNTVRMLEIWRERGVDFLLREAHKWGVVLSGLSAGANCWFRQFNTDSPVFDGAAEGTTVMADGLGFFDLTVCPHFTREVYRRPTFSEMMLDIPGTGVALDDGAALDIRGDEFRIVASLEGAGGTAFLTLDGVLRETRLAPSETYRPMSDLRSPTN